MESSNQKTDLLIKEEKKKFLDSYSSKLKAGFMSAAGISLIGLVGWKGVEGSSTSEITPPLDPNNIKECEKDLDNLSFEEAQKEAQKDVGDNGYFQYQGKPYPTFNEQHVGITPADVMNQFICNVLAKHKENTQVASVTAPIIHTDGNIPMHIASADETEKDAVQAGIEKFGKGALVKHGDNIISTLTHEESKDIQSNPETQDYYHAHLANASVLPDSQHPDFSDSESIDNQLLNSVSKLKLSDGEHVNYTVDVVIGNNHENHLLSVNQHDGTTEKILTVTTDTNGNSEIHPNPDFPNNVHDSQHGELIDFSKLNTVVDDAELKVHNPESNFSNSLTDTSIGAITPPIVIHGTITTLDEDNSTSTNSQQHHSEIGGSKSDQIEDESLGSSTPIDNATNKAPEASNPPTETQGGQSFHSIEDTPGNAPSLPISTPTDNNESQVDEAANKVVDINQNSTSPESGTSNVGQANNGEDIYFNNHFDTNNNSGDTNPDIYNQSTDLES